MDEVGIALAIAAALSGLISVIEIRHQSRAELRSCFGVAFLLYLAILLVGNVGTTLLAITVVGEADLPGPNWFWYGFVGVFGFEALLQNINVTMFGKGVLSINLWISKARDNAVAAAIRSNTVRKTPRAHWLANRLTAIPMQQLNAYVVQGLSDERLAELDRTAQQTGADPALIKALALAHEVPDEAEAVVRAL